MTISKGILSVLSGALAAAAALNLPAPYGVAVSSCVAAVAYLMNHEDVIAMFLGAKK